MQSTQEKTAQTRGSVPVLLFGDAGQAGHTEVLRADMDELVEGRLLVESDPGGGKTHVVWSLCEQTAGTIPHLIVDPEGEYAPLRRDHKYVLASATPDEGDVQAHPSTAAALTRFLVEHNLSAIFDIYDLDEEDRELFVDNVGAELLRLPRSLWSPRMLLIDEAEQFAPEQGSALSKKRMRSLTKRGRKRGIFTVFCIQQMAHFDKGVAGGIANKLVGRTTLDTSLARAAKDLGLDGPGREVLKNLPAKSFLARGPAFGAVRPTTVRTAPVKTRPPRDLAAGLAPPPPPPDSLTDLLGALREITPEPDELTDDPEELRAQIRILRQSVDAPGRRGPAAEDVEREVSKRVESRLAADTEKIARPLREEISRLGGVLGEARAGAEALSELLGAARPEHAQKPRETRGGDPGDEEGSRDPSPAAEPSPDAVSAATEPQPPQRERDDPSTAAIRPDARAELLRVLLRAEGLPGGLDRRNLAVLAGHSPLSSTHGNNVSSLHREGLLSYPSGNRVALTRKGSRAALGAIGPHEAGGPTAISLAQLHEAWLSYLSPRHAASLVATLRALIRARSASLEAPSRDELARRTNQSPTSSTFGNNVALLKKLELVAYPRKSRVRAGDLLFPEGMS